MKDIGIEFKDKREEIGISKEEASNDMSITIPQLENLEDGSVNAFKDIFFLKELVKKYAIYLNLDHEKIIERFNEFVFDFTSRIYVDDINAKMKESLKEEKDIKKINSPYTLKKQIKKKFNPIIIYIFISIFLIILTFMILNAIIKNTKNDLSNQFYNIQEEV
ncbi:MAG: helix-turn-helix domain-containing protein [Bacilli bacterium]